MAQPRSTIAFSPFFRQAPVIDLVAVRAAREAKLAEAERAFTRLQRSSVLARLWRALRGS